MSSIPDKRVSTNVKEACLLRALERIGDRNASAQICVLRDGQVVLKHAFGCEADFLCKQTIHGGLDLPSRRAWPGTVR